MRPEFSISKAKISQLGSKCIFSLQFKLNITRNEVGTRIETSLAD